MKGIKFGNYHSWDDFSLILNGKEIEAPSPKVETVDIPGGDGVLDYTEYFGGVKYNNRKLKFNFSTIVSQSEFLDLFSAIQNAIHGQKMKIILDDDPDFYYFGRVTVDSWKADKNVGKITIECDCEPYKYKLNKTTVTNVVTDSAELTFANSRKPAVPAITLTAAAQISFSGSTYALGAGTTTSGEIVFSQGNNVLTITGSTTITVEYQEGEL